MCKMFEDFLMKITYLCLIIKITAYYISALLVFELFTNLIKDLHRGF